MGTHRASPQGVLTERTAARVAAGRRALDRLTAIKLHAALIRRCLRHAARTPSDAVVARHLVAIDRQVEEAADVVHELTGDARVP